MVDGETYYAPTLKYALFEPFHEERAAVFDPTLNLYLWDMSANTLSKIMDNNDPSRSLNHVVFSNDGRYLAVAVSHCQVRIIEWQSGQELLRLSYPSPFFAVCAFSPDNRTLAITGHQDRSILLVDLFTGRERLRLPGHRWGVGQAHIYTLAFSPDGRSLASGATDGTILLWDVPPDTVPRENSTSEAREKAWDALGGEAGVARPAIATLVDAGPDVVALFRARWKHVPDDFLQLVRDLDTEDFDTREKATRGLMAFGPRARAVLQPLLENKATSFEVRMRALKIVEQLSPLIKAPEILRHLRAIQILEHLRSTEADRFLEELSKSPGLITTTAARNALQRRQLGTSRIPGEAESRQ